MTLLKAMQNRRSIRRYTDEPVPKDKMEMILAAGLLAASSRAIRPWEFIVVQDRNMLGYMLGYMSACRQGGHAKMLEGASGAIVFFSGLRVFQRLIFL